MFASIGYASRTEALVKAAATPKNKPVTGKIAIGSNIALPNFCASPKDLFTKLFSLILIMNLLSNFIKINILSLYPYR